MEITLVEIINDVNDEQPSRALLLIEVILLLKVISHGFSVHKLQQPLPLLLVQVAIIAPNAFRRMGKVGARVGVTSDNDKSDKSDKNDNNYNNDNSDNSDNNDNNDNNDKNDYSNKNDDNDDYDKNDDSDKNDYNNSSDDSNDNNDENLMMIMI
jgi:hypothetical protein